MKKILALIPARYASTRFPGKPLVDILGKPMIQHVYERTSALFSACYVATDDNRIFSAVQSFGGSVTMTSDAHRSGTDRCCEALNNVEKLTGEKFDIVINVQGDEPFIDVEQLRAVAACFDDPQTDIATLVKPFSPSENIFNPNSPKVVLTADGFAMYFSRSPIPYIRAHEQSEWQKSHTFYKHIGLYAYRAEVLREIASLPAGELEKAESLEQLRWLENGYKIRVAHTDIENCAIDTPADLENFLKEYAK